MASTLSFAALLAFAFAAGCGAEGGGDTGGNGRRALEFGACDGSPTYEGEGTYYAASGAGACSFGASSETPLLVGAMNAPDYGNSAVCGACAHLKGPNGEVTVRIVDLCPECAHGDIDLSPAAFEMLAPLDKGRIPISWQFVPCGVSGPIVYHFKDGSHQWWTAVHIRNHRNAIAKFEYKAEDGSWRDVGRVEFNYFIDQQGMGPGPYSFRVTDVYGNVLEDTGIPLLDNADAPGKAQFPACGTCRVDSGRPPCQDACQTIGSTARDLVCRDESGRGFSWGSWGSSRSWAARPRRASRRRR